MIKRTLLVFKSTTFIRTIIVALVASLFSFLPTTASHATVFELPKAGTTTFTDTFPGGVVSLTIPANSVISITDSFTLTVSNAGSADLSKIEISIAGWVYGTDRFASGKPAKITMPESLVPNSQLGYSEDNGETWIVIPSVADSSTVTDSAIGTGYVDLGATIEIYTYHLSIFGSFVPIVKQVPIPDPKQKSTISSMSPISAKANTATPVVITGSFVEDVKAIQVNGVAILLDSWKQTPTTLSFTVPAKSGGTYSIQVFNGSAPVLGDLSFTVEAAAIVSTVKKKVTYIRCVKGLSSRISYGFAPICPKGYAKS